MRKIIKFKALSTLLPVFVFIILLPMSANNFSAFPIGKNIGTYFVNSSCAVCNGTGRVACSTCDGKGITNCNGCHGEGNVFITCNYCLGKKNMNGNPCPGCSGTGTNTVNCSKCSGKGGFRCTSCSFSGVIMCEDCSGTGTIIERFYN